MEAYEQYFHVVLFILLHKSRWFELLSLWMKVLWRVTIQMEANKHFTYTWH